MVIQQQRLSALLRANTSIFGYLLAFAVLMHTPAVWAQADQGAVTGVVRDSSGGAIPNAAVVLTNVDTGLVLNTRSNSEGVYVFSPVKIGNYQVTATASGFAQTLQQNLALNIQQRLTANLTLKPAGASETVEVNSASQLLQTEDAAVGQVLTAKVIDETPLAGRNWVFVAQLTAGIVPSNGSKGQAKGDFSANGQREEQNNFILDGVDNNTNFPDFLNGQSFIVRPPPDALAQFKVQTTDYTAEFGHSAGAIVNASLKTGTNAFHGALWEYFRNDVLNTRTALPYSPIVPKYNENQFGFTLGGPIVKEKLFFFVDSEANRIVQGTLTTVTVPTLLMRKGDFSELLDPNINSSGSKVYLYQPGSAGGPNPGVYTANPALNPYVVSCNGQINVYCANQLNQTALNVLNKFPLPLLNSTQNNSTTNVKLTDNTAQWDARADWNVSQKDQAFIRYSYLNEHLNQPSPLGPILNGTGGLTGNLGENFAFSETHIFTSKTVNEFRIGYNYGHLSRVPFANGPNVATDLGLGGIPFQGQLPSLTVSGLNAFGTPAYYPGFEYENVYQILDNLTHVVGNHSLKFGFNFQRIRVSETKPTAQFGSYTFNGTFSSAPGLTPATKGIASNGSGIADFVTNQMASASITPLFNTDDVQSYRAAYAQDDWKVTPTLTLNIGIRYEIPQPYIERNDNQANFYPTGPLGVGTGSGTFVLPSSKQGIALPPVFLKYLAQDNISLTYSNNRSLTNSQYMNLSPRLGFAYSPTDKLVIRGGYGLFYGGLESIGPGVNLGQNVPFNFTSNFLSNGCSFGACKADGLTLESGFTAQIAAGLLNSVNTPLLTGNQLQQQIPYSQQYNLAVQYSVARDTTATIGYVGSVSRHLQVEYDPNRSRALMTSGANTNVNRAFPQFSSANYTEEAGTSSYNSLQASLERHYSKGITFLAAYTYAHSLDNAQADLSETSDVGYRAPGIIPLSDETSNSGFDVRHRFALNGNYELPFGVGRQHLNHPGLLDLVAGGWSSTLTFRAQTGEPFSIVPLNVSTAAGLSNAFPVATRNPFSPGEPDMTMSKLKCPTVTRTIQHWFNPCAFSNPIAGTNIPAGVKITDAATAALYAGGRRLSVEGPGYERIDMSVFKRFHTRENQYMQFRADVFNLFNTPAYNIPGQNNDGQSGGQILSVKQPMAYAPDSRFFQFSLKYSF